MDFILRFGLSRYVWERGPHWLQRLWARLNWWNCQWKGLLTERRFLFVEEIGRGTYGTIYRMVSGEYGEVAVKVTTVPEVGETRIWPRLRHDAIVPLLEVMRPDQETAVFVMPVMMTDLHTELYRHAGRWKGVKDLGVTKGYLVDVLRGLEYLHGRGFCHLDLHVANVFITASRRAVIGDFGFARSLSSAAGYRVSQQPAGYWEPPEISVGDVYGDKFDMFSFGLLAALSLTDLLAMELVDRGRHPDGTLDIWYEDVVRLMHSRFPSVEFSPSDDVACIHLIHYTSHNRAALRMDASTALRSAFLKVVPAEGSGKGGHVLLPVRNVQTSPGPRVTDRQNDTGKIHKPTPAPPGDTKPQDDARISVSACLEATEDCAWFQEDSTKGW